MIELYALTSPNVKKIFIVLEELGLPYRVHPVDVWKGEQFEPEFLRLNPNGKIPVIVDLEGPEGRPYTVFESGAILIYLAEKTGKLLPREPAPRFEVIQWLMIQLAGIGPYFGQLTHFSQFAPANNEYALTRYKTETRRLYEVCEARLGRSAYLGGPDYSIADIATFPWMANHDAHGVRWSDHPHLARWFESIDARPAVKRALEKVDALKASSSRETATSEDLDRFFQRGRFARA